jgi:hypothetical protein
LADDQIELKILHGRVEDFLYHVVQPMNLVNKKNIPRFEVGEDGSEISRPFQHRAGGGPDVDVEFLGNYIGNRSFAQARKAVDQNVIKGFMSCPCCLNKNLEVVLNPILADKLRKAQRSKADFEASLFFFFLSVEQSFLHLLVRCPLSVVRCNIAH